MPIKRVHVTDLFGHYEYNLVKKIDNGNLMIFYGDNGTGKTTILKMIYYLVSYVTARNHKNNLAKIKFKTFLVEFEDGSPIEAIKENAAESSYVVRVCKDGCLNDYELLANADGVITRESGNVEPMLQKLREFDINIHFISDRRRFMSFEEEEELVRIRSSASEREKYFYRVRTEGKEQDTFDTRIRDSIRRAEDWVQKAVLHNSGIGQINANSVYLKVAQALCNEDMGDNTEVEMVSLVDQLKKIATISASYSEYGMATGDIYSELMSLVQNANAEQIRRLNTILKPFLDGTEARLDGLRETYEVVKGFSDYLSIFFGSKDVSFNVVSGLLVAINGEQIQYKYLSSGEKQLLSILCNVLSARDSQSIFIIDEPEISLNVKWQRMLIRALLDCSDKNSTQFVLATHSVEMISQHMDDVIKLENLS